MYDYQAEREHLFTDKGQQVFLRVRDRVRYLLDEAGAVRINEVMKTTYSGDSWTLLACFDRMKELGELREITGSNWTGQHRVFVAGRED